MTGSITEIKRFRSVLEMEWHIPLPPLSGNDKTDIIFESPDFDFKDGTFYLRMKIPRRSDVLSHLQFFLINKRLSCPITIYDKYELRLKDETVNFGGYGHITEGSEYKFMPQFKKAHAEYKFSDIDTESNQIFYCKMNASSNFSLGFGNQLSDDLYELMMRQYDSDLKIRVKEKLFNLHRNIITARAPFFASMISAKATETSTDILDIEDFDEHIFMLFFEYLYSGGLDGICEKEVLDLYELSNRYQVHALKEDCLTSLKSNLSAETFFKLFSLIAKYDEKEIKKSLSKFCSENLKELMKNKQWIVLMKDNAENAYELLATALENYEAKEK